MWKSIVENPGDATPPNEPLKNSYIHGASSEPLVGRTVWECLQEAAREKPDRVAIRLPQFSQDLTYKMICDKSTELAKGLLALGMKKGDFLTITSVPDASYVYMVYAAAQIGVVFNALKSKTLVIIENEAGTNVAALKELIPDLETFGGRNIQSKSLSFEEVTKLGKDILEDVIQAARDAFTGDDPINTGLSSGSTGVPKCSVNSHFKAVNLLKFSLLRYADYKKPVVVGVGNPVDDELVADYVYWVSVEYEKDIQLVILPSTLWDAEFQGENEDEGYHMEDLYKSIHECRITHLELYPTFLMKGLELDAEIVQKYDTSSVKRGILTSTVITEKLRERCSKLIPEFVVALGTTEYWNISITYPLDDDFDRRYRGIGFPPPHTEVKIVDANNKIVPLGVEGEICVRGVFMFSTYYGSEDLYRKVVSPCGWYHTGDIGTMNEHGFMYYIGRKFHVLHFSRWGDKVYPAAIEIAAAKHPKISLAQAVGFKKPGEDDLDTIILCVIPIQGQNITEGELRSHCQSELLDHMWPDHYVVMDTFPRVGIRQKVSKEKLLKLAKKILLDSGKLQANEVEL
ncbi:acyl-CoA synthetase family member 2, mitochondrial-like [Lingula anatina]|uniref:Acyl-CoA synthetase family member 2, mitochondrial-like n=1 Tax=Lingula anatina TaxID=7574 RepID=A0A1S3IZY4_LINAN|nr:acyl-CoA synthetase family member 2, mitochondrial-like [Lingula anatina]|eukprot:XP_013403755.1 acyl-CoA synthetase family member 2, mitochondrial-like [Lingula anatina]